MLVAYNSNMDIMLNSKTCDISKKIKNFIIQKKNFESILNIYKKKILFPKEFIQDIKNISGLENLSYYIQGYNSFIKEARNLSYELKKVSSWVVRRSLQPCHYVD